MLIDLLLVLEALVPFREGLCMFRPEKLSQFPVSPFCFVLFFIRLFCFHTPKLSDSSLV